MWPIIALAAVFIAGCSSSKDDSPSHSNNTPPPPPVKPPESDQVYRRSCLIDSTCSNAEREAALYDYVGAIYGEKGKVHFGKPGNTQILTVPERSYVVGKFGAVKLGETDAYLSNAQSIFFRDLKFPADPACRAEVGDKPPLFSNSGLGTAVVLHGRHGCGQSYADQLMKGGIELSIAADPKPWRFYLESYGTEIAKKVALEEMSLFTRMAEILEIPLANPLPLQASSLEVRQEAAKTSKYSVEDFATAIVFQIAANAAQQNPQIHPMTIFRSVIDKMAPELKMKSEDLFEKTRLFLKEFDKMRDQLEESDRRLKHLADTANRVNFLSLKNQMPVSKDAPARSLFVVGSNHVDLVRDLYSSNPKK